MKKNNALLAGILIFIGLTALMNNIFGFNLHIGDALGSTLPIIIPGMVFQSIYFYTGRRSGLLVPGGILMVVGVTTFFDMITAGMFTEFIWPLYPLSVPFGLYQLYRFKYKELGRKGLLTAVRIITYIILASYAISICFVIDDILTKSIVVPVILILIGGWILVKNHFGDKAHENK